MSQPTPSPDAIAPLVEPKPARLSDRRSGTREPLARPCKLFHRPSRRYASARTHNISPGGALIELDMPRLLMPGEEVDLVIAWRPVGVLDSGQMIRARVVRASTGDSGRQMVALEYSDAGQLAVAA